MCGAPGVPAPGPPSAGAAAGGCGALRFEPSTPAEHLLDILGGAAMGVAKMARQLKKPVHIILSDMNEGIDKFTDLLKDKVVAEGMKLAQSPAPSTSDTRRPSRNPNTRPHTIPSGRPFTSSPSAPHEPGSTAKRGSSNSCPKTTADRASITASSSGEASVFGAPSSSSTSRPSTSILQSTGMRGAVSASRVEQR